MNIYSSDHHFHGDILRHGSWRRIKAQLLASNQSIRGQICTLAGVDAKLCENFQKSMLKGLRSAPVNL